MCTTTRQFLCLYLAEIHKDVPKKTKPFTYEMFFYV